MYIFNYIMYYTYLYLLYDICSSITMIIWIINTIIIIFSMFVKHINAHTYAITFTINNIIINFIFINIINSKCCSFTNNISISIRNKHIKNNININFNIKYM